MQALFSLTLQEKRRIPLLAYLKNQRRKKKMSNFALPFHMGKSTLFQEQKSIAVHFTGVDVRIKSPCTMLSLVKKN